MDRLTAMRTFAAVAVAGSFSGAARTLGTPLATVSRNVAQLESEIRVRLLNRTTRSVTLTAAGERYLDACRRILADLDEADSAARGDQQLPSGRVAMTAPLVFGRRHVLPIVLDLLAGFPDIDIRLMLTDRVTDMIDEGIDVAVRLADLGDSSLAAARVGSIRRIVCASPAYLAAHGVPETPAGLAEHACIDFPGGSGAASWLFRSPSIRRGERVALRARLSVSAAEAAIDAAESGLGLARLMSYQAADSLAAGRLVRILADFEPLPVPVLVAHPGGKHLPARTRAVIDFLAPRLRARLAAIGIS